MTQATTASLKDLSKDELLERFMREESKPQREAIKREIDSRIKKNNSQRHAVDCMCSDCQCGGTD